MYTSIHIENSRDKHLNNAIYTRNIIFKKKKKEAWKKQKKSFFFYVFLRLLERKDVSINDRLPLSILIVTREGFDEFVFPSSSNKIGSGRRRMVNLGKTGRSDVWFVVLLLFVLSSLSSLSTVDEDNEVTDDVLEWRLEQTVGRQRRKLGLFVWTVVDTEVDDDEYWDTVRWRPSKYVRGDDDVEEEEEEEEDDDDDDDDDDEIDKAGERRREWVVVV